MDQFSESAAVSAVVPVVDQTNTNGTSSIDSTTADKEMTAMTTETTTKNKASKGNNHERYVDAFPPLGGGAPAPLAAASLAGGASGAVASQALPWTAHVQSPAKKTTAATPAASTVTQIFTIPLDERRYRDGGNKFGANDNQKEISDVIRNFPEVNIEVASSRDRSLTVVLTGRAQNVAKAKASVMSRLQTQTSTQLKIPQEHHGSILGKQGTRLREIETNSATKIQVPRPNENSDIIEISGTREGIEKARHELKVISDELSKMAFERLDVPKMFHPFVRGPFDRKLAELRELTGARINVPPYSVNKDEITVAGEKEPVMRAVRLIRQIHEDVKASAIVSVEVNKAHHKYIIGTKGSGLSEILESTGVSVEVPASDVASETILLRGDATKLGVALTQVYSKANSQQQLTVVAPAWLHRFIIGKGGATLAQITQGKPKVHISFSDNEDRIMVEGPSEEVTEVQAQLKIVVDDLMKRMKMIEVRVEPRFHKHIIGKAGSNIKRIKDDTGCNIRIPSEVEGGATSDVIRIEGNPAGVDLARVELLKLAEKLENEKSKDLIIEQRFHRLLIGQKGSKISDLKESFPEVQIHFPDQKQQSDIVTLRGPRDQVVGADKMLSKMFKDTREANFELEVKIFKQFHKNIVGKGGATITKIKEETGTRIQLPDESADSDVIRITGRRKEVEEAGRRIEAIQREMANIGEVEVQVPHKLHTAVIGPKGRFIQQLQDECGGVQVHFPAPGAPASDVVRIRGPKPDLDKARRLLDELVLEKREASFERTLRAKPEFHKFLIGRRGVHIEALRKETSARVVFPDRGDADQELITVIGREVAVAAAEKLLLARIAALENVVEEELVVDPKWHRHFVQRRGELLNSLSEEYGGVTVSFPKNREDKDAKVRVKGPAQCVADAIKRLLEIVDELENEVTLELLVAQKYHKLLIGRNGCHVQAVSTDFNVNIKFPSREVAAAAAATATPTTAAAEEEQATVDLEAPVVPELGPADVVTISGRAEQCELAKAALLALVPVTETVPLQLEFHRLLIGPKGSNIRQFNDKFEVQIKVPNEDAACHELQLTGAPAKLLLARAELDQQVARWQAERADREAHSFQVQAAVAWRFHRQIIGPRGAAIQKLKARYGDALLRIDVPSPDKECDVITVTGYREQAEACAAELEALGRALEAHVTEELFIHSVVHPRLIGKGGRTLARLSEQLDVEISMPARDATGEAANLIRVRGAPQKVDEACDHVVNLASEWLDEMREHGELDEATLNGAANGSAPVAVNGASNGVAADKRPNGAGAPAVNGAKAAGGKALPGFKVVDAPWDASSAEDFPSIGGVGSGATQSPPTAATTGFKWGGGGAR